MDPEPAAIPRSSTQVDASSRPSNQLANKGIDDEDPYTLSSTSIALFGLTMAIAVVGVPLVAVLTERPLGRESLVPTTIKSDGSKSSLALPLSRLGQSPR
jgi:hypothetical protein